MSIDPLAEKYAYNSTYAFQENKMGLGRELEGLELAYRDPTAAFGNYVVAKVNSIKSAVSDIIKSILIGTTTEKRGTDKSGPGKNGIALSDGGNNQDPSALPKGGRDVIWGDFGGSLEVLTTVAAFELNVNFSPVGKGTNGGRATMGNKADDAITAVDNGINAGKAIKDAVKEQKDKEPQVKKDTLQVLHYGGKDATLQKTEKIVDGKTVKIEKNN